MPPAAVAFPPPLTAAFADAAAPANSLFPRVSGYADGRVLVLVLALVLSGYLVLAYACGRCSRRATRWLSALDAFASASVIVGAAPRGSGAGQDLAAFRAIKHTTAFGGTLTLVAALVALGVCLDVIQQYATDDGVELSRVFKLGPFNDVAANRLMRSLGLWSAPGLAGSGRFAVMGSGGRGGGFAHNK